MWILIIIIDILAEKTPHIQEIGGSLPTLTWAACGVASGNPAARRGSPLGHPSLPLRMKTGPFIHSRFTVHLLSLCKWEHNISGLYIYVLFLTHEFWFLFFIFLKKNLFIYFGCIRSWLQCLESSWQHAGSFVIARKLPFSCCLRA